MKQTKLKLKINQIVTQKFNFFFLIKKAIKNFIIAFT